MMQHVLMAREAMDLRLRFEFGFASLEEIERWADLWLLAFEAPPEELIDLALARKCGEARSIALMRQLNPAQPMPEDILRVAGYFAKVELSPSQLRDLACRIEGWAIPVSDINEGRAGALLIEAVSLVDAFDLAESGQWGSIEETCIRTRRFLDDAQQFTATARGAA